MTTRIALSDAAMEWALNAYEREKAKAAATGIFAVHGALRIYHDATQAGTWKGEER